MINNYNIIDFMINNCNIYKLINNYNNQKINHFRL